MVGFTGVFVGCSVTGAFVRGVKGLMLTGVDYSDCLVYLIVVVVCI